MGSVVGRVIASFPGGGLLAESCCDLPDPMAATFQQLWQATGAKVGELQPASVRALCAPPLACLPPGIAAERLLRIREVPFADLFSLVAVLSTCRPHDHLAALELLGVIEAEEALEEPAAIAPVPIPHLQAPSAAARSNGVPMQACQHCGAMFQPTRRGRAMFCSTRCSVQAMKVRRRAERVAGRAVRECPECGKSFKPQRRSAQTYCSPECQADFSYTRRGLVPPSKRPPRQCVVCGADFQPAKHTQKTCSASCSEAWRRERQAVSRGPTATQRIAALAAEFSSPGRWRWLLRQVAELGLDHVAELAELEPSQLLQVIARIRAQLPARRAEAAASIR